MTTSANEVVPTAFLTSIIENAIQDRMAYLDAWSNTDATEVAESTQAEINRMRALKGKSLARALKADAEGLRLAMLAAEGWYESLADAQVGKEKKMAERRFHKTQALRIHFFGKTRLEAMIENCESAPIHLVAGILADRKKKEERNETPSH